LLKALIVPCVGCGCLVSVVLLIFLELNVLSLQLLHCKRVRLLLEANLRQLLLEHLDFILRLTFLLFLSDQVTVEELALMDLSIDVLLFVFDLLLHLLLLGNMDLEIAVYFLLAHVEIRLASFSRVFLLRNGAHLLLQLFAFFVSLTQIGFLSFLICLLLEVLGLLPLAVFLEHAVDGLSLLLLGFLRAVLMFKIVERLLFDIKVIFSHA